MAKTPTSRTTTKKETKKVPNETFGQRLIRLRTAAGMQSPSDLARKVWGEKQDGRGFMVANNRDTIWRYEHDKGTPSRRNIIKLAAALGCSEADLDPERFEGQKEPETLGITVVDKANQQSRLVLDMVLPSVLVSKVYADITAWLNASKQQPLVAAAKSVDVVPPGIQRNRGMQARARTKKAPAKKVRAR